MVFFPYKRIPTEQMSFVTSPRKDAPGNAFHLLISHGRGPHHGRRMFPMPVNETEGRPSTLADCSVGQVPPVVCCKPQHPHYAAWPYQLSEPGEPLCGVHVVQCSDREYSVERFGKGNIKDVAMYPLDG